MNGGKPVDASDEAKKKLADVHAQAVVSLTALHDSMGNDDVKIAILGNIMLSSGIAMILDSGVDPNDLYAAIPSIIQAAMIRGATAPMIMSSELADEIRKKPSVLS